MFCSKCAAALPAEARFCLQCGAPNKPQRQPVPDKLRFEVFRRDEFTCQYCGRKAPNVELHVDHRVPVARGGSNHVDNLISACSDCNLGKGSTAIDQGSDNGWLELQRQKAQHQDLKELRRVESSIAGMKRRTASLLREYERLQKVEIHEAVTVRRLRSWETDPEYLAFFAGMYSRIGAQIENWERQLELMRNEEERECLRQQIAVLRDEQDKNGRIYISIQVKQEKQKSSLLSRLLG